MPKTVLIILAAVVALIVIVVLTGMRYLRADDEDDFDDDVPAEHGRSRGRAGHLAHEQQARLRQRRDEDPRNERDMQRPAGSRPVRPAAGRGGERGTDQRRDVRAGQARGWREDSGELARSGAELPRSGADMLRSGTEMPRSGRAPMPQRDQRPARAGRRDLADMGETVAVGTRPGRTQPSQLSRGPDDFDSQPGRMPAAARDYERETADGRGRRDGRDRVADPGEDQFGDRRDGRDRTGGRGGRDGREHRESRPAAGMMADADRDERDRRSTTRPNARPDGRKNGSQPEHDELLPAVKPRPGKGKRDSEGDWPSNEWDELSDVDYWAELASDRPLTTQVPSGQPSRSQRRESREDELPARVRAERPDTGVAEPATKQVSRPARRPDPAILPAASRTPDLAAPERLALTGRPADSRPADSRPADSWPADARPADVRAAIADDDPLTSPSFPRIEADDSRSYRRTRAAAAGSRHSAGREPDAQRPALASAEAQTGQHAYPAVPAVGAVRGLDGAGRTRSYPRPAAGADYAAAPAYPSPAQDYASPDYGQAAQDAYSSLPSSRSRPASNAVPVTYQVPAVAGTAGYQGSTGGYSGPDSVTASYSTPANSGGYRIPDPAPQSLPDSSYQPAAAYPPAGGYLPPASGGGSAGHGGYSGETVVRDTYPGSDPGGYGSAGGSDAYQPPLPGGYQPDPGLGSYPATDSYPGTDGYPGTDSYRGTDSYQPAGGYPAPADPSGYANGRPAAADGLPGYAGSGPASGSHARPESGYLSGSYSHDVEASLPGSRTGGHGEAGYPGYPAHAPAGRSGSYQVPAPQLPGYPDQPYQADGYDQAGFGVPAPETGGYAGADPYAADPYGYPGYGGNGY